MKPGTIFACEAQPIVVEGLQRVLEGTPDLRFAGAAAGAAAALQQIGETRPDVALIDQSRGMRGAFQLIAAMRDASVATQAVLWITEAAESEALRSLQFGARGVVRKTLPVATLLECLRAVLRGEVWIENGLAGQGLGHLARRTAPRLTPREREIVQLICRGMRNKQIAESLQITAGTVKVHLMHVFEKTGVKDRFELALHGRRVLGEECAVSVAEPVESGAESVALALSELAGTMVD